MTDLATRSADLERPARYAFDSDQIAAIKRTVARDCTNDEFIMFMEIVGRYQLDPFVKHIYAAKMPARDGAAGQVAIIVSRDGLLAIANRHTPERHPDDYFEGIEGDVVREGDHMARSADGFVHTYDAMDAAERKQKRIIGAWAKVYRRGRRPTFFFADFDSYAGRNKVWQKYQDAMILKVAESMALRKAFSVSGVVGEDEVGASYGQVPEADTTVAESQEPNWGDDPIVAQRLRLLVEEANRVRPGSFRRQKMRLQLAGASDTDRLKTIRQLEDFVKMCGGEVPDVVDAEAEEAEEADGEVAA